MLKRHDDLTMMAVREQKGRSHFRPTHTYAFRLLSTHAHWDDKW